MSENSVAILLSTYNGEKYIARQIDSLLAQEGVQIHIFIRDDGSTDNTVNIIKQRYLNNLVSLNASNNIGFARSFWRLLETTASTYDYYAFCDQDDVWEKNKLSNAIKMIKMYEGKVLYTSDVKCIDEKDKPLELTPFNAKLLNQYETFQFSNLPGCTFVFNKEAKTTIERYKGPLYAHDWAAYIIIRILGTVIFDKDNKPVLYRIHGSNTIGVERGFTFIKRRFKNLLKKSSHIRSEFAEVFYDTFGPEVLDQDLKREIYNLGHYRSDRKCKLEMLRSKRFKGAVFKLYILLNRV